jgi:SAM-dependent methyltransferase/uncharacterized membrane protein YbhN (UPF0104 family)
LGSRWCSPRGGWAWALALAVVAAAAWGGLLDVHALARGLHDLLQAAGAVPATALAAAVALAVVQNVLAALRLHVLARPGGDARRTLRAFALGQAANAVLPGRAGEALKILGLRDGAPDATARAAGAVLVADKLVDGTAGLAALLGGAALAGPAYLPHGCAWFPAAVGGCVVALVAAARSFPGRASRVRTTLAAATAGLGSPRRVACGLALAATGWALEALALGVVAAASGHPIAAAHALLSLALLNLATLLPVTPLNAGTFEVALGFALVRAGVPTGAALGVATVHHVAQLAGVGLLALVAGPGRAHAAPPGVTEASKARAIRHYDARAPLYERAVSRWPLRHLRVRERSSVLHLAALHDPASRTVIDVGCGSGFYARAAKRAGKWVHAVDAAPGMVERVRADVDVAEVADVEALAPARTYDVVICCGVLDFVACPEAAFDNLCRLCAPGGRLVLLVPREGAGGFVYRMEKRLSGIQVNVYRREWLAERARRRGLVLESAHHPLPTNMALLFRAPAGVRPP